MKRLSLLLHPRSWTVAQSNWNGGKLRDASTYYPSEKRSIGVSPGE